MLGKTKGIDPILIKKAYALGEKIKKQKPKKKKDESKK